MLPSYRKCLRKLMQVNTSIEKQSGGVVFGIRNMRALDKALGFPSHEFKSVHVTGTNGKGSVCLKLSSSLKVLGYHTGLFVSPHISSIRERCQVDHVCISEKSAARYLQRIFQVCDTEDIAASFFEIVTAMSFLHFADSQVDFAVVEVGLGGRLDATNVIPKPEIAVITNVGLDHTRVLGDTIEKICEEKAGIIKPGTRVCVGPHVPLAPVRRRCNNVGATLDRVLEQRQEQDDYDEQNTAIATGALEVLLGEHCVTGVEVKRALRRLPPCRFQVVQRGGASIVLDVAHNPLGLEALFKKLQKEFPNAKARVVFAMSHLKDSAKCLEIIASQAMIAGVTMSSLGDKFVAGDTLVEQFVNQRNSSRPLQCHVAYPLEDAINATLKKCQVSNDLMVVCGSIYIMAEVRRALRIDQLVDPSSEV